MYAWWIKHVKYKGEPSTGGFPRVEIDESKIIKN